ncbi:hypothetical protein ACEPAH_7337 [Sanghuangporus vaninii]
MPFDLTIGTEPAKALQDSIQNELQKRGFSPDADPVMAEYITIMLINNKTAEQITAELEDLIGASEYDPSFTDWLFAEATRKSQPVAEPVAVAPIPAPSKPEEQTSVSPESGRRAPSAPRSTSQIYNQALNQALPSTSSSGHKRTASARSPSPVSGQPNKSRRMDLPTGPRAMHGRDSQRSLLDRMSGRQQGGPRHGRDEIQARIDAVTNQGMNGMNGGLNNNMGGMMMPGNDMAAAAAAMGGMMNPMALQEMMMNQMALMAQMANTMGMLGNQGQFPAPNNGFPPNGANAPFQDGQQHQNQQHQRRGGPPAGRGGGKGPLKAQWVAPHVAEANKPRATSQSPVPAPAVIAAPTPQSAAPTGTPTPGFIPPARPQSPSLCKFGLKCTNALCRYSHPSPVATAESGVVLSNDPCEAGLECKDKDCIKAHASPAAVGVSSIAVKPKPKVDSAPVHALKPPCRYGANCTKAASGSCPFSHPFIPKNTSIYAQTTQCRFGAACTKATCPFQHPPGRVLPGTFHRGLEESAPTVAVRAPQPGTIGGPSPHRSVVFNKPGQSNAANEEKPTEQKDGNENTVVEAAA